MATKKLTPKQVRFVEEYLIDLNACAAAKRSGYSQHTAGQIGHELLKKENVVRALVAAERKRSKRVELDQDWIIERLRENTERSMQAAPVVDSDGNPVGEYRYEGSVANRALELLGKHLGMFADRLHVEGPMLDLSLLTDGEIAQLRSLIAKARREQNEPSC